MKFLQGVNSPEYGGQLSRNMQLATSLKYFIDEYLEGQPTRFAVSSLECPPDIHPAEKAGIARQSFFIRFSK